MAPTLTAMGSTIVLGNSLTTYRDRTVSADVLKDPSNSIVRAEALMQEVEVHSSFPTDKARWRRDVELLPHVEFAFNDLTLWYSSPECRLSAAGRLALQNRPDEFVEAWDGELVTGRAGNNST